MITSALLIHGVPVECINQAAIRYYVPAKMIVAVLNTEGGWPGLAKPNKNGTFDFGPMQINSTWLSKIAPYGYTAYQLQYDPCINVQVGAWILSREIANEKNFWDGVANYHSHTPLYHNTYKRKINIHYVNLEQELNHVR
ncbi:MAG: lytic transglycosylase domain-containing protein [Candidatus Nitrosotenuis sp.]